MDVLMLGGANTGKSTFLVQLYGRMAARMGRLVTRSAPADLKPISDGLQRLASGIPLEHTRTSADHLMQHLPAATNDGRSVDFNIPEYAGETLDDLVRSHRIPEHWRPLIAESDQWLLFVRLEQFGQLPDTRSKSQKRCSLAAKSAPAGGNRTLSCAVTPKRTRLWPVQIPFAVHLLQSNFCMIWPNSSLHPQRVALPTPPGL